MTAARIASPLTSGSGCCPSESGSTDRTPPCRANNNHDSTSRSPVQMMPSTATTPPPCETSTVRMPSKPNAPHPRPAPTAPMAERGPIRPAAPIARKKITTTTPSNATTADPGCCALSTVGPNPPSTLLIQGSAQRAAVAANAATAMMMTQSMVDRMPPCDHCTTNAVKPPSPLDSVESPP